MSHGVEQPVPNRIRSQSSPSAMTSSATSAHSSTTSGFFSGGERRIQLDEVTHLCQFGNNLVAVLGQEGVGKTAFLTEARNELVESAFCCFITGTVMMSAEDIFTHIISQLELPVSPSSNVGAMIATLRHGMALGNLHRVVVIIDDAHHLSDAILSALVSLLQGNQSNHLHILVSGDFTLVERFDQFEMVDVLIYDVSLKPFNFAETVLYLNFKLAASGYQGIDDLPKDKIKALWAETGGYPRAINQQAQTLLFEEDMGEFEQEDEIRGLPLLHMSAIVVLLAAFIMALFYMGDGDVEVLSDPHIVVEQAPIVEAVPASKVIESSADTASFTAQSNLPEIETEQAATTLEPINTSSPSMETSLPVKIPENVVTNTVERSQATESQVIVSKPELEARPVQSDLLNVEAIAEQTPTNETLKQSLTQQLEKEAQALGVNSGAQQLKSIPSQFSSAAEKSQPVYTANEQAVLTWPDANYTLQVIGANQEEGLKKFVQGQPNRDALRLITVNRGGQPWYIVVTGNYETSLLARKSIQNLPQAQVNGGPWPRKISDIKQEIKAFRRK